MKKPILFAAACLGGLLDAGAQTTCVTAVPVIPGTYTTTGIVPSEIPNPLCAENGLNNTNGSLWYTYTPVQDTAITVTSDIAGFPTVDTRVHIYTGACGALVCAGGDDDSGAAYTSVAVVNVSAGTTYYIAFDNRWTSNAFTWQLIEHQAPPPVEAEITFVAVAPPVNGTYLNCVVDMDRDGLDDVVAVNNTSVVIGYQQAMGGFTSVTVPTPVANFEPWWSICAGDLDGNGRTDLLYGDGQGVGFMYAAVDGLSFAYHAGPDYVFSQRSNMVDINNDGHLDAFVCHDTAPNVYYLNDGEGNLTFVQGGIGPNGGNYGSLWTDYDNDGDQDCFIAKCGSSPPDVFMRNNGDGTFTDVAPAYGLNDGHQSWSSAWGDFDNDGDMDVLIGDNGSGYHKLMRNDGTGFTNVTTGSGLDTFDGSSRDWVTHDFNNDGRLDILGGGGLMLATGPLTFGPNAISPGMGGVGDLNNDGFLDVVTPGSMQLNQGNDNNWLHVIPQGTVSNPDGIGARIMVTSALGTQVREIRSGDGFEYMSTLYAHFGLGEDETIEEVVVRWPSGVIDVIPAPAINGTLTVVEGLHTGVDEVVRKNDLMLFPNPAVDVMMVTTPAATPGFTVRILDATGKLVLTNTLGNGQLNVSALQSGVYLLTVTTAEGTLQQRFTKR